MANESKLEAVRDWVVTRLASLPDFEGVPVLSRKTADLLNEIDRSLLSLGVGLIVHVPEAKARPHQSQVVLLDPARLVVTVLENVLINQGSTGTGKGALFLAERVLAALQMQKPLPDDPKVGVLKPQDPAFVQVNVVDGMDREDMADLYSIDCNFQFTATLDLVEEAAP